MIATPRSGGTRAPVSVVIPTYNGAKLLRETLASVAMQTIQPAEVLVVDDGSSDDSADVATDYGARVIRQKNLGICAARNTGILAATQPLVALLDHDDLWAPEKLECQLEAWEHFPDAVLIATDCRKVRPDGTVLADSMIRLPGMHYDSLSVQGQFDAARLHRRAVDELAGCGWFLMPSATLIQRDALLATGMFDVRTPRAEDVGCFLRLLMRGGLVFIDRPLTSWVIHESNSSADAVVMMRGQLALTSIMEREPARFPASYRQRLVDERAAILTSVARLEIAQGRMADARANLREAVRHGAGTRASLLLLASYLGRPLFELAARTTRRFRSVANADAS